MKWSRFQKQICVTPVKWSLISQLMRQIVSENREHTKAFVSATMSWREVLCVWVCVSVWVCECAGLRGSELSVVLNSDRHGGPALWSCLQCWTHSTAAGGTTGVLYNMHLLSILSSSEICFTLSSKLTCRPDFTHPHRALDYYYYIFIYLYIYIYIYRYIHTHIPSFVYSIVNTVVVCVLSLHAHSLKSYWCAVHGRWLISAPMHNNGIAQKEPAAKR